jgi:SSS family solute:Na+ symporter
MVRAGGSHRFPLFGLILVKRIYNTGKITISGAIAEKYGNSTKNIISLIMIYALLLVNVGNYVSGAAAISTVLKVNLPVAAFITAIVSTFYFAFGGMKGVAWVTMLHSALKYAGLLIILGFALSKTGGFTPMIEKMPDYYWTWDGNIGAGTIFAWLIGTIGSIFCTQFVIQAISSPKTSGQQTFHLDRLLFLPAYRPCHRHYRRGGEIPASGNQQPVCPAGISAGHEPVAGRSGDNVTCGIDFRQRKYRSPGHCLAGGEGFLRTMAQPNAGPGVQSHALGVANYRLPAADLCAAGTGGAETLLLYPRHSPLHYRGGGHRLLCPVLQSTRGANAGLIGACVVTSVWYLLGDPFGINNMYVALATPAIIMVIDRLIPNKSQPSPPQLSNVEYKT